MTVTEELTPSGPDLPGASTFVRTGPPPEPRPPYRDVTVEQAIALLAERAAKGPSKSKRKAPAKKKAAASEDGGAEPAPKKKAAAKKKAPAKKTQATAEAGE